VTWSGFAGAHDGAMMLPHDLDVQLKEDDNALAHDATTNQAAWDALYRCYVRRVYHYVRMHTSGDDDAADITQQTFLRAFAALEQTTLYEGFAPWLFRIAHNVVITAHQRQHPTVPWDRVPEAQHPRSDQDPESVVLQEERLRELHRLLEQLAPNKRELIALRFAAQLSFAEIAIVVGKHADAVKKQIYRILQGLKEQYRDDA